MTPILVTGAAKGLGAEICKQLAQKGHDLVIHYRNSKKEALAIIDHCQKHNVDAELIRGDFSSQETTHAFIQEYLQRFPHTKGLVNNVGDYQMAPLSQTRPSDWQGLFNANFFTPVFLTNALIDSLALHQGCVINIGVSGLQSHRAFTQAAAYCTTKSALLFYTVSLAKELASKSIRVNMVSPGYIENSLDLNDPSKLPFKRAATLVEVAKLAAHLFDPDSSYITGQNIEVAGGVGL